MIRLTNDQGRAVLAHLLASPDIQNLGRVIAQKYNRGEITPDYFRALTSPTTGEVPEDLGNLAEQVLLAYRSERDGHKEVLDLVLEMIRTPLAGNLVTSSWVAELRNKLLQKDEQHEVVKATDKFLKCSSCGHSFDVDGEEAIIIHDGNCVSLQCRACRKPRLTACKQRGCDNSVIWDLRKTSYCEECQKKRIEAVKDKRSGLVEYTIAGNLHPIDFNPFEDNP
jgi:hypothetical protein